MNLIDTNSIDALPGDIPKEMTVIIINDYNTVVGGASSVAIQEFNNLKTNENLEVIFLYAIKSENTNPEKTLIEGTNELKSKSYFQLITEGIVNRKIKVELDLFLRNFDSKKTIVHIHSFVKAFSYGAFAVCHKLGFKICYTTHDYFLTCPNGAHYNFTKKNICKLKPGSLRCLTEKCDRRNSLQKIFRYIRFKKQSAALSNIPINIIGLSDLNIEVIQKNTGLKTSTYKLLNPISTIKQARVAAELNGFICGYVGHFSKEKGADVLSHALDTLSIKSVFIGAGELQSTVENGDSNRKVLGWMNHTSLYEKMKSFSCLVFPSRWYEGQPLVVLEALSMGIPVICSDSCAAKEFIIEGKNGFLFRSGDQVDLRKKIQMILDHGKLKEMSIYAYEYFWNNYPDNDKHTSDLIGIYQKVLGI